MLSICQGCEAEEQSSLKQPIEEQTRQRLSVIQERLSKLIDIRFDGTIDSAAYQMKLEEYNKEKQELSERLNGYKGLDKADLIIAREVLELAQEAKDIFLSSKLEEKQQLLGFFFSNFTLNDEKLDLELREPFRVMQKMQDQHVWRHLLDTIRTGKLEFGFQLSHIKIVFNVFKLPEPQL